jgi:hypothetical protein
LLCDVGVNNVATEQRLWVWYLLHGKYIEGAVDSRTGKVYIVVKQIDGTTDILLCAVGVNNVATEQRLWVCMK